MSKGLVCIATGNYIGLVDSLVDACNKVRIVDHVFCLTDNTASLQTPLSRKDSVDVLYLPWGGLAWPLPTLWRYHAISVYSDVFRDRVSHMIYCDVDMRPLDECGELFGETLVAATHPGYWSSDIEAYPYESNPSSQAFVQRRPGLGYVAGGVQGGPVGPFLSAASEIRERVQRDYLNGTTAVWHDESHWNRFVADHSDEVTIVGPEFCWPESWPLTVGVSKPRLLALEKDHHALRGTEPTLREKSRSGLARIRRGLRVLPPPRST
jgi:hypothetical protein